jgi:protease II
VDHLLAQGHATSGSVALQAVSAGGVLAANLLQSRPEDFGGAVLRMPFLDLFTAMTDPSQALTQHEWDEWGHPEQPGGLELLRTLCPYQVWSVGPFPVFHCTEKLSQPLFADWFPSQDCVASLACQSSCFHLLEPSSLSCANIFQISP